MSASTASRSWRAAPGIAEWVMILLTAGSVGVLLWPAADADPQLPAPTAPDAIGVPVITVEHRDDGSPVARFDESVWQQWFEQAGLPDPPGLNGADPVPVTVVRDLVVRWQLAHDSEALGDLGQVYLALEKPNAALKCFAALRELEPAEPRWAYLLGAAAQSLGREQLAIDNLEAARRDDPGHALAHARLGTLYLDRGDLDGAFDRFESTTDYAPKLSLGFVGLARVAMARDETDKAVALAHRARELAPDDYRAYRVLGQALARQGDHEQGRMATRISERLPQYSGWLTFDARLQAAHGLANSQRSLEDELRFLRNGGAPERVAVIATALLERRPSDYLTIALLAKAQIALKDYPAARATISRGLDLAPDFISLYSLAAQVDLVEGHLDDAMAHLDRAMTIDPNDASVFDILGRVLFLQLKPEESITAMRRSISLEPRDLNRRYALAEMLARIGRTSEAIIELEALLEIAPNVAAARTRLEQLRQLP